MPYEQLWRNLSCAEVSICLKLRYPSNVSARRVSLHRDRRYSSKQEIDLPAPDNFILKALREALHVVTERSNIDMVRLLVEKGDDTEAKDKWQQGNWEWPKLRVCSMGAQGNSMDA